MILMVDNDGSRMEPLKEYLMLYGYDVELKMDVDGAMNFILENIGQIELIILDIMMPNGELLNNLHN